MSSFEKTWLALSLKIFYKSRKYLFSLLALVFTLLLLSLLIISVLLVELALAVEVLLLLPEVFLLLGVLLVLAVLGVVPVLCLLLLDVNVVVLCRSLLCLEVLGAGGLGHVVLDLCVGHCVCWLE